MLPRTPFFFLLLFGGLVVFGTTACSVSEPAAKTDEALETAHPETGTEEVQKARSHFIRGVTAMELDDMEAAEAHLTRAHSVLYESSGVNFTLAELYFEMDDYHNGLHYGNMAVDLEPDNKWYRLLLVDGYRATGQYGNVMNQLDSILAYYPSDVDVLFMKAQIQSEQGHYEASNETYQQILDLAGPDRSIFFQRISNFTQLDDTDGIIDELQKMLELDPGNINTLMMLSQFFKEQDKTEEARKVLEEALERKPRNPETLVNLADIHINREEWERAGELLDGLVGDTLVSTENKLEIVQYVISRFSNDMDNEALERTTAGLVDTLLHTESGNGMVHAIAAEFFMLSGQEDKALLHLEKTTDLIPENEAAWRQLIQTYYVEGRYQKAIDAGKEADEFVPDDPFILFFIGGSYFLKDNYREAASWLQKASELPSRSGFRSIILGTLGDVHSSLENWDDADRAYDKAIELDPDNDVALNNYAYYLSERDKRLDEAMEMVTHALELNPENAAFLDTKGWIYFKKGNYEKAREYIRASIDTGEASAEVMEHMGDVYDKLGKPDRALYWWQKALEEDGDRTHLRERLHIDETS